MKSKQKSTTMRRTLLMIMAVALLLTQCRKPEVKFPSPVAPEGTTVSMTVTAGPGSKTDITAAGAITWSEGDKLYVGFNGKYVGYLTLTSGQNTPTGWFSGNVTLPTSTTGNQTFHFFYLGSGNGVAPTYGAESVVVSFATQEIYAEDGKLKNASKHHVGYGSAKGTVAGSEVTGINVTLVSKVALARFSFTKDAAAYMDVLTLSGTNIYNSMTVGFGGSFNHGATSGSISLTGGHGERYVMLVPTGDATEQTLTFAGSSDEGEGKVPGLESNKFYGKTDAIPVTLTASAVHVTSVSLNETSLSLAVGGTATLTATVAPDNATDKSVIWSSTAESVATVADGTVTAVAAGTATIRVTTVDGNKTAECAVTVTAPAPTTHVFSVSSTATVEFSPGNLYYDGSDFRFEENQWSFEGSWKESHVSHFKWSGAANAVTGTNSYSGDLFCNNNFTVTGDSHTWRTLTCDEWNYLLGCETLDEPEKTDDCRPGAKNLCEWKELDSKTHKGLVILPDGTENPSEVLGSITKTSDLATHGAVFLPAAGYRSGTVVSSVGSDGYYWSSAPRGTSYAYYMYFRSDYAYTFWISRSRGHAVRLVRSAT